MAAKTSFLFRVITLVLMSFGGLSVADPAAYPERVDRFRIVHEQKLGISQEARRQANAKKSVHRQRAQERKDLEAERDRLANQVLLNQSTVRSLNESNTSLVAEANRTRSTIQENVVTRDTLLVESDRLQTALGLAQGELRTANDAATAASQAMTTAQSILREATSELSRAQGEARSARERASAAATEIARQSAEINRLEARVRELTSQKLSLSSELERLVTQMQTQRERIQWLEISLSVIAEDLADLAREKTALETQIATLRQRASQETQRAQTLQNELQALVTQKQNAERAITEAEQKIRTEQGILSALDIEKLRLEESLPIQQNELDRLLRETPPPAPQIQALRDQMARSRQELLAIPGKKAEARTRIAALEGELASKRNEIAGIATRSNDLTQSRATALAAANQVSQEIETKTRLLTAHSTHQSERFQEQTRQLQEQRDVQEQARLSANRKRDLDAAMLTATNSLRGVEVESLPAARQALATATSQKAQAESDASRWEGEERRWLSARDARQSSLTEAERVLTQKRSKVTEVEALIARLDRERAAAISRRAELLTENASLERKMTSLQERVTAQQSRIRELDDSNSVLGRQIDAVEVRIAAAREVEGVVLGAFQLADVEATRLESDTTQAQQDYAQAIATYQSERANAIAQAVALARPAGAREGEERGNPAGSQVGRGEGTSDGSAEGTAEGKNRDYEASLAAAHARALEAVVASGANESAVQRAQREADSTLQSSFDVGHERGLEVGRPAGFTAGNNATKQEEGRRNGYDAGKRRAETEAEQSHRPLGRSRAEAEILAAPPGHREERDATEESVSSIDWKGFLRNGLRVLTGWILPDAMADRDGGVITADAVPAVGFRYRRYEDSYPHADLVAAYREAYDSAYAESYVATYIEKYRAGYQASYAVAFDAAKAAALAVSYDVEKQRGERDGTAQGTFDGLGFNAGRAQGFSEGKANGERTAIERGFALGEPQGHRENIAGAQAAAEAAGRADMVSQYRSHAKIRYVASSQKLEDANGNGKFEIGEGVTLTGVLRNFGGVAAPRGSVRLEILPSSVAGIELSRTSIPLGEIAANTEVSFKKLLVGTVKPGSAIALTGKFIQSGADVAEISVNQPIYAPYQIAFSYFYEGDAKLRVSSVGDGTGYHNAVWAKSLGEPELLQGLQISLTPVDPRLIAISWGGGATTAWASLDQRDGNWVYTGFFLTAYRSQGLATNRFRVQLRKAGEIVFDQVLSAPIEVR